MDTDSKCPSKSCIMELFSLTAFIGLHLNEKSTCIKSTAKHQLAKARGRI